MRGDKQFLETPFYGVHQMTWHLRNDNHVVNEKRIRRLMGLMPIHCPAGYRVAMHERVSKAQHKQSREGTQDLPLSSARSACGSAQSDLVFGYHLPAHLPMRRGFLYLVAIMDLHTRKVLAWRISNTLEAEFCVDALNEAIHKFAPPKIMNTDQGSQFTSFAWTDRLRRSGVRISMDGKGRFLANIFVERLWRSLKYECVYLHAWETGSEAKAGVG